ncbi:hypothetical protein PVAG01_03107 [Phlyctema vagabunda]|uniref:2EXR domain-containing protein n=1 Tax=Phlyctema vagabunda TaxID=108571 RepID=A0ABR4PSJ7_9HELO
MSQDKNSGSGGDMLSLARHVSWSTLSPSVRQQIFDSWCTPRIVQLKFTADSNSPCSVTRVPAVFQVCQESRKYALERYSVISGAEGPVYIDYSIDTLQFGEVRGRQPTQESPVPAHLYRFTQSIRQDAAESIESLSISYMLLTKFDEVVALRNFLMRTKNLKCLHFFVPDYKKEEDEPKLLLHLVQLRKEWRLYRALDGELWTIPSLLASTLADDGERTRGIWDLGCI